MNMTLPNSKSITIIISTSSLSKTRLSELILQSSSSLLSYGTNKTRSENKP